MDNDLKELVQQAIDGANSPEDAARLEHLLEFDPSARTMMDEMTVLASALERLPSADPPIDFTKRVMAALPVRPARAPQLPSWMTALSGLFAQPRLALVYASIAGIVVIAAGVFALSGNEFSAPNGVAGTMGGMATPVLETRSIQMPGVSGTVSGVFDADVLTLDVALDAPDGATVSVEFNATAFALESIVTDIPGEMQWAIIGASRREIRFNRINAAPSGIKISVAGPDGTVSRVSLLP